MRNSRWLITGAAGFIGSHVVDYLLQQQAQVLGIDNFSTGLTQNVQRLQEKYATPWKCLMADVRDAATLQQIFQEYKPDYVVHLAAQISVPDSIKNPELTHDINVTGFLNVLHAAKRVGVRKFIYISSSAVYGEQTTFPIAETATLNPMSPYGLSKLINEQYAGLFADPNFCCIGLRLFNIFGPFQRPDNPYAAVIAKWLSQVLNGESITIFGDGSATRDYCHVYNVTAAIGQLAEAALPQVHNIYNIGCGKATSLQELAQLLLQLMQRDSSAITYQPWRAGDILHSAADITRAQREFGYQVRVDLATGLQECLNTLFASPLRGEAAAARRG